MKQNTIELKSVWQIRDRITGEKVEVDYNHEDAGCFEISYFDPFGDECASVCLSHPQAVVLAGLLTNLTEKNS